MKIAAVINYCTNDYRFLSKAIQEATHFAQQILVPVCDHFFDGSPEDRKLLVRSYRENQQATFIEFAFDVKQLYTPYVKRDPADEDWVAFWHSTGRYLAFLYADSEIDHFLFLDSDEIVEGARFRQWLDRESWRKWDAMWFNSYCYGLEATRRAPHLQMTALLAKRSALSPLKIFNSRERFGIIAAIAGPRSMQIMGCDGKPMLHHYSWVRPKNECLKKVRTWGKKHICDWEAWLEQAHEEMKEYQSVPAFFDPLSFAPLQFEVGSFSNVIYVNPKTAFLKELDAIL